MQILFFAWEAAIYGMKEGGKPIWIFLIEKRGSLARITDLSIM